MTAHELLEPSGSTAGRCGPVLHSGRSSHESLSKTAGPHADALGRCNSVTLMPMDLERSAVRPLPSSRSPHGGGLRSPHAVTSGALGWRRMSQVVSNLLRNAIAPELRGPIDLSQRPRPEVLRVFNGKRHDGVRESASQPGSYVARALTPASVSVCSLQRRWCSPTTGRSPSNQARARAPRSLRCCLAVRPLDEDRRSASGARMPRTTGPSEERASPSRAPTRRGSAQRVLSALTHSSSVRNCACTFGPVDVNSTTGDAVCVKGGQTMPLPQSMGPVPL